MITVKTHKRKRKNGASVVRSHARKVKAPGFRPIGVGNSLKKRTPINTKARKIYDEDNDMMAEDSSLKAHPKTGVYRRSIVEADWNSPKKKLRYGKSHSSTGVSEGRLAKSLKKKK